MRTDLDRVFHADDPMTFRVYVRWPGQRVSDKTATDSQGIAQAAFDELQGRADLARRGALGVALTLDGKQVAYHPFDAAAGGPARTSRPPID